MCAYRKLSKLQEIEKIGTNLSHRDVASLFMGDVAERISQIVPKGLRKLYLYKNVRSLQNKKIYFYHSSLSHVSKNVQKLKFMCCGLSGSFDGVLQYFDAGDMRLKYSLMGQATVILGPEFWAAVHNAL